MNHPFQVLKSEYEALLASMSVTRPGPVNAAAETLLKSKQAYLDVQGVTGVPAVLLMGLMWRERNGGLQYYLGNGQPLSQRTTIVPKGRGPFSPPDAWKKGALDAIKLVHLDDNSSPWSWSYICWKGEAWNGFGPRNHGVHTGYLWAGSNHYTRGKYVSDGKWDPSFVDTQVGIIPVVETAVALDPSLAFDGAVIPRTTAATAPAPLSAPEGVDGGARGVRWLQMALNKLGEDPPLLVDDNYGKGTREAVRVFQAKHHLTTDGLAGPKTIAAIDIALRSGA